MHIRDFVTEHSYAAAVAKLTYLKNLGINAIELMPVNEFEGNSSWGYNTSFYFAADKYYGTKQALQNFIDECHKKGIAVILDMVLNHSFGQSPMVQLYWDAANKRPAANNPWFNPTDKHPYGVGYDFNHGSADTKYFAKNVMKFWLNEYKVDGFRFDLSKGFTQNYTADVNAWGAYDASRIAIWKDYNAFIKSVDPNAYVILEHFAADNEEKELATDGMMLWNNVTGPFKEASMGWLANSNFGRILYDQHSGFSTSQQDKLVGYMESHDEERAMYKNMNFGNQTGTYNIKNDLSTSLARQEMTMAFMLCAPGPKMIWQFGELGYDVSIEQNGRLSEKPILWNYYSDPPRKALYDALAKIIKVRIAQSVFQTGNFNANFSAADGIKYLRLFGTGGANVVVVGNFNVTTQTANITFPANGTWYDFMNPGQTETISGNYAKSLAPGEYHIYTTVNYN
jgi:1,4-alpha-glucan branching enzyme